MLSNKSIPYNATADVLTLDDDSRLLTGGEIAGIQRIMRKAPHSPDVLEHYRNRPVWADTK